MVCASPIRGSSQTANAAFAIMRLGERDGLQVQSALDLWGLDSRIAGVESHSVAARGILKQHCVLVVRLGHLVNTLEILEGLERSSTKVYAATLHALLN